MRRWIVPIVAAALVVGIPMTVLGVTLRNGSPLDHQRARVRSKPATTSSTSWAAAPGLGNLAVCAKGQVSATVSVVLSGGPAEFRMDFDGGPKMKPRVARFDPGATTNSFSFTFIAHVAAFEASDGHLFTVEWRSPTGAAITLKRGDVNLLFHRGSC